MCIYYPDNGTSAESFLAAPTSDIPCREYGHMDWHEKASRLPSRSELISSDPGEGVRALLLPRLCVEQDHKRDHTRLSSDGRLTAASPMYSLALVRALTLRREVCVGNETTIETISVSARTSG